MTRLPRLALSASWCRPGTLLPLLLVVVLGIVAVYRTRPGGTTDVDGFYQGGQALLQGAPIYGEIDDDGERVTTGIDRYPPFFALVMATVAWLPIEVVGALVYLLAVASLIGLYRCSLAIDGGRIPTATLWLMLLTPAAFWLGHLLLCQINLPILFLGVAGIWLTIRQRPGTGGAMIGLASAIKPPWALLGLFLLLRGRWKAFAAAVATGAACWLLTMPVLGVRQSIEDHLEWRRTAQAMTGATFFRETKGALRHNNNSLAAVVARLFTERPGHLWPGRYKLLFASLTPDQAAWLTHALQAIVLGLVAFVLWRRRRCPIMLAEVAAVLALLPYFSPLAWTHYFVNLIPAYIALARTDDRVARWLFWASVVCQLGLVNTELRSLGNLLLANSLALAGVLRLCWQRVEAVAETAQEPAADFVRQPLS